MAKPSPKKLKVVREGWVTWNLNPVLMGKLIWDDGEQVWRDVDTPTLEWEPDQVFDTKLACVLACQQQASVHLTMLEAMVADLRRGPA